MTDVSIIVISKRNYQALNKLINSIEYQNSKLSFEVLILSDKEDYSLTNYFDTHYRDAKKINLGRGNYFLDDEESDGSESDKKDSLEKPTLEKISLIRFDKKSYLEILNRTIQEAKSNHILILEDKYLLGRNFFKGLLQTIGDEKTILHPEFSIFYNGKTALKQFGNNFPSGRLFEKNIYENIIYSHKNCFRDVKFTNPFGNEFWQFYCDALALDYKVKIGKEVTIFENIIKETTDTNKLESVLVRTELFEGNKLLNIQSAEILNKKESAFGTISKAFGSRKGIKQLIRNYVNNINSQYLDISNNEEYFHLIKEWKEANKIEPLLFPEEFLIKNIELIDTEFENLISKYTELEGQYKSETRYLLLIPSIRIGGGIKVVQNYIRALLTKYNPKEITVVVTDDVNNDDSLLPFEGNIIHLKNICDSDDGMMTLLLRLIMQKSPYAVHNINAELGYKLFAKYAKFLFNASKLYLTHFVPNISVEGKITGHMLEYLPLFYDYLTAVSTDNRTVVDLMDSLYGMGTDKYYVHYQPVEIRKDIWTEREKSLQKKEKKKTKSIDGPIKILWASRIDYQKNIPLLYDIAKHYANEPKTKDKEKVEFLVAGVVEENSREIFNKLIRLSNVKYLGPFNDVSELPFNECDLFLYTSKSDGIPIILLEIMMLGEIPIIASKVGAVTELVGGGHGFLCSQNSDYYNAIEEYITNPDNEIYSKYVLDSQIYVKENHNPNYLETRIKEFKEYY